MAPTNSQRCGTCGAEISVEEAHFCDNCGTYLGPSYATGAAGETDAASPGSAPADMVETIVQVASYALAAGVGGVIGNRSDAGAVALFRATFRKWRLRTSGSSQGDGDPPLVEEEAIALAKAAACQHGYDPDRLEVAEAREDPDGTWVISLRPRPYGDWLRVRVPSGNPLEVTVLIEIPG